MRATRFLGLTLCDAWRRWRGMPGAPPHILSVARAAHIGASKPRSRPRNWGELSMSEADLTKNAPDGSRRSRAILLQQTLPYIAVLTLAILGVAYTDISHRPLTRYWEFFGFGDRSSLRSNRMGERQGQTRL